MVVIVIAVAVVANIITEVILRCPRFTLFVCIHRILDTVLHFVGSLYLHFMLFGSLLSKTSAHLMCIYKHGKLLRVIHPSIYVCAVVFSRARLGNAADGPM